MDSTRREQQGVIIARTAPECMIEDLTILDDSVAVWLAEDKTHKREAQTIVLKDRPDLKLVPRLRRWVAYLARFGITKGPVFRHLLKNGGAGER